MYDVKQYIYNLSGAQNVTAKPCVALRRQSAAGSRSEVHIVFKLLVAVLGSGGNGRTDFCIV